MKIIREIDDNGEHPYCPKCNIPLWREGVTYSYEQNQQIEKEKNCEHDYGQDDHDWECKKCGHINPMKALGLPAPENHLYRCRSCCKLFEVGD